MFTYDWYSFWDLDNGRVNKSRLAGVYESILYLGPVKTNVRLEHQDIIELHQLMENITPNMSRNVLWLTSIPRMQQMTTAE